jgi:hypothetical protein
MDDIWRQICRAMQCGDDAPLTPCLEPELIEFVRGLCDNRADRPVDAGRRTGI